MPQHTNEARKKRRVIPNTPEDVPVGPALPPAVIRTDPIPVSQPTTAPPRATPAELTVVPGRRQEGVIPEFARGVESGLETVSGLRQGFTGAAFGAVGLEDEAKRRLALAQERETAAQINAPRIQRVQDVRIGEEGGLQRAADFVAGIAGKQGVIFAPIIAGGIAGAATRTLPAVARAVSPGFAAGAGAVGVGAGLEAGDAFTNIVGDPESVENLGVQGASLLSLGTGAVAGSVEAVPALFALRRIGILKPFQRAVRRNLVQRFGTGAAAQSAIEGATEAAQTVIQRTAAKFANENREILGDEGIDELINSTVSGAIFGAGVGGITGAVGPIGQQGSVEDQVDLEEALDELDAVGGRSSDIEAEIDELGEDGQFIRDARARSAESRIFDAPEEVIGEIVGIALSEADELSPGGFRDRKMLDQMFASVRELENPTAQLPNILLDAGVPPDQVDTLAAGMIDRADLQEEEFLQDIADQRGQGKLQDFVDAPKFDPDTGEPVSSGFQELFITTRHILRNRNGKLGFVPPANPQQENALRTMLNNLEADFPDITFKSVGLGDAIFDELDPNVQSDKEKSTEILLDVAGQKLGEEGFNAANVTELDPADPRAFLNQFRAIRKDVVDASLTGRDELRLTDTDIRGIATQANVTVAEGRVSKERLLEQEVTFLQTKLDEEGFGEQGEGGNINKINKKLKEVLSKKELAELGIGVRTTKGSSDARFKFDELKRARAKELRAVFRENTRLQGTTASVQQKKPKFPIVAKRKPTQKSDFVANVIVPKKKVIGKHTFTIRKDEDQTVDAIALTNKMLTKLQLEGKRTKAVIADAFFNGIAALAQRDITVDTKNIPAKTVIASFFGKDVTFGEIMQGGAARIRARIASFQQEEVRLKKDIARISSNLQKTDIDAETKRKMKFIQRKLKRRIEKIPVEAAGLRDALTDAKINIGRLKGTFEEIQEELLLTAEERDMEFLADLAVEAEELARFLQQGGFHTLGVEQLLNISKDMDEIVTLARNERQRVREAKAPEGSREAGFAPEADPGPTTPQEILDAWALRAQTAESVMPARGMGNDPNLKVLKVLREKAKQVLKALGLDEKVRVLVGTPAIEWVTARSSQDLKRMRDGALAGKAYAPEKGETQFTIIVNPWMTNQKFALETLAHEIGHVVMWELLDPKSESMKLIQADYEKWLLAVAALGPDTSAVAILASRKGIAYARESLVRVIGEEPIKFSELTAKQQAYAISFDEWFADQVAKHFLDQPAPARGRTALEATFKKIADSVKEAFEAMNKVFGFRPAKSVSNFLDQIMNNNAEEEITVLSEEFGGILKKSGLDSDTPAVAGVMQTLAPFSEATPFLLRKAFVQVLEAEERNTLFQFFNRVSTKRRLKKLVSDPAQAELIESNALHAAVFGYQMWIAGKFKFESEGQRLASEQGIVITEETGPAARFVAKLFLNLFDFFAAKLGFVTESEQAEQIFDAVRSGYIDMRKLGQKRWSVVDSVRDTLLKRIAQSSTDAFNKHLFPIFDKMLGVAQQRMLDTGIPGLLKIADGFFPAVGREGKGEAFFEARRAKIGLFMNSYTALTRELRVDPNLKRDVLAALRNPSKRNQDPDVKRITAQIFKFNRRFRNYLTAAGIKIGDKGPRYFPWVWDMRKFQDNSDFVRNLLLDDKFAPEMNNWLRRRNDEIIKQNAAREEGQPEEELIDLPQLVQDIMISISQNEAYTDTELNPSVTGTTPWFASMHTRALGFITESGKLSEAERTRFDGLFSEQMDLTMMTYIRQGVKRAEYARRFGSRSEKLQQFLQEARAEGASDAQMDMAHKYIDAMTGSIGEATTRRIYDVLGLPQRRGEVINPHFRTFSSIAMVVQNLAVLPLATLTSLVDPVGIAVRSQDLNATMAALRAGATEIAQEIRNLVGNDGQAQRSELRQLAEGMGTIEDHMTNEALEWEYGSTYLTPRLKAANEFFFNAIGLTQWTRVTRLMALAGGKEFIKRHIKRPNQNSERFLRQLDLDPADVRFTKSGDIRILTRMEREGRNQEGDALTLSPEELARDDRVRNALNRFVDEAILRPNAAQRPIWGSDPNYSLIIHLKSFMFSFHDRILRRAISEAGLGNIVPVLLLSAFVPAMLFADILRDMIRYGLGGNPRKANWGLDDHIWSASQRSGLNGIGQLLIDAKQDVQFGGLGYESLIGPTADGITDLGGLFSDDDQAQWNAFTRNLPANAAWKHWFDNGFDESSSGDRR